MSTEDKDGEAARPKSAVAATLGVLFLAALALYIFQLTTGKPARDPNNWFSRIFLAGTAANVSTIALLAYLRRTTWSLSIRNVALVGNWILSALLVVWLASAVWSATA